MQGNASHGIRNRHMKSGTTSTLDESDISRWTCHLPGPVGINARSGIVPIIAKAVVQSVLIHQRMLPTGSGLRHNLRAGIAREGQGGMAAGHHVAEGRAPLQANVGLSGGFRHRHVAHVANLDAHRPRPIPRRPGALPIHRIHPPRESKGGVGPAQQRVGEDQVGQGRMRPEAAVQRPIVRQPQRRGAGLVHRVFGTRHVGTTGEIEQSRRRFHLHAGQLFEGRPRRRPTHDALVLDPPSHVQLVPSLFGQDDVDVPSLHLGCSCRLRCLDRFI
mmetsp:Transcript_18599/g.53428  ORF Transcript_18599/g.53428 Transcript_18599/m.53428 type:complete len:274 (+) Transcript_18599:512-1333(+)